MPGEKFGTVLGEYKGVKAFSSDYDSADDGQYPDRRSYISFVGPHYCGYKHQCVEYSRRFYVQAHGITYGDVGMAYEIFTRIFNAGFHKILGVDHDKGEVRTARIPAVRCKNGELPEVDEWRRAGLHRPQRDMMLINQEGGYFRHTGHVAIITDVVEYGDGRGGCRIIEQNVSDRKHPEGREYSRELPMTYNPEKGTWYVSETTRGSAVLGWVSPRAVVEHLFENANGNNNSNNNNTATASNSNSNHVHSQQPAAKKHKDETEFE